MMKRFTVNASCTENQLILISQVTKTAIVFVIREMMLCMGASPLLNPSFPVRYVTYQGWSNTYVGKSRDDISL